MVLWWSHATFRVFPHILSLTKMYIVYIVYSTYILHIFYIYSTYILHIFYIYSTCLKVYIWRPGHSLRNIVSTRPLNVGPRIVTSGSSKVSVPWGIQHGAGSDGDVGCCWTMILWEFCEANSRHVENCITYEIWSGWYFGTFGWFFPSYWERHHPIWRTHIFCRGVRIPPTRLLSPQLLLWLVVFFLVTNASGISQPWLAMDHIPTDGGFIWSRIVVTIWKNPTNNDECCIRYRLKHPKKPFTVGTIHIEKYNPWSKDPCFSPQLVITQPGPVVVPKPFAAGYKCDELEKTYGCLCKGCSGCERWSSEAFEAFEAKARARRKRESDAFLMAQCEELNEVIY